MNDLAPLAQWQSTGLLIRGIWVRPPGGARTDPALSREDWVPMCNEHPPVRSRHGASVTGPDRHSRCTAAGSLRRHICSRSNSPLPWHTSPRCRQRQAQALCDLSIHHCGPAHRPDDEIPVMRCLANAGSAIGGRGLPRSPGEHSGFTDRRSCCWCHLVDGGRVRTAPRRHARHERTRTSFA